MEWEVHILMTADAQCYQIFESVVSQPAPGNDVMHLKVLGRSAVLAFPAVACEHLFSKFLVSLPIESKAALFLTQGGHEAFRNPSRKLTFMAFGSS